MQPTPSKYTILQDWERGSVKKGDAVYSLVTCDYALAHGDTRHTGIEHISVTKNESGEYNGFTIPIKLLDGFEHLGYPSKGSNLDQRTKIGRYLDRALNRLAMKLWRYSYNRQRNAGLQVPH